jgi:hypothetical protein
MNTAGNTGKRNRRVAMAILFLPTLPQRLTFLGVFVFVAVTLISPSYAPYAWSEIGVFFVLSGGFALKDSMRKTGSWAASLWRGMAATLGVVVFVFILIFATRLVAAGGSVGASSNSVPFFLYLRFDLIFVALWLLFWIPQLFFDIQLDSDGTGDVQRVLLGPIAVTASVLTGTYILMDHFGAGPLRRIPVGPLVAGVVGMVILLTPAYRSLAGACWRRGIVGILHLGKRREDWGKTLTELGKAIDQASERKVAPGSGKGLDAAAAAASAHDTTDVSA